MNPQIKDSLVFHNLQKCTDKQKLVHAPIQPAHTNGKYARIVFYTMFGLDMCHLNAHTVHINGTYKWRLSVRDIASCTGISEGSVQTILKKRLELRKVCASWVPHSLTEEQKTQRLKCARELLKIYKGCNSRVISNLLTGDETWVHMFEPQRRADSKQRKRKDKKRPGIAKRSISSKKMLYAIFFNSSGPVVQVPCPSGHTVTGRFYKNSVMKKVKEFYNKKRPSKGWSGVHLLHDNASSHKCEIVKSFLASENVKVLNHPPYSPDLSPCDFFLFPRLKKMLSGNKYISRSSLGSAIYQCLQQIPKEDYLSAFRDWVKRLQKCVSVGEYFEGLYLKYV